MAEDAKKTTKKAAPKKAVAKKVTKKTETPKEETVKTVETPVVVETKVESTPTQVEVNSDSVPMKSERDSKVSKTEKNENAYTPDFDLKEMLETGAHFGHQAKRWHPKMAPYIYAKKGDIHIFDLIITSKQLTQACQFAYQLGKQGKTLVFVGTKRQAKDIIKAEALNAGAMYIMNRWLGGFITNWEQVSKSIREMVKIRKGLEDGSFKNYTKKERVVLDKTAQRLERFFGGVAELKKLPDALFIVDAGREETAITEANSASIPVIAVVDSNDNPTAVDYVIPANDDAVKSIEYMVKAVGAAYKAGREAKK